MELKDQTTTKPNAVPIVTGFFVDWDGFTRRFESPGADFTCRMSDRKWPSVDVIDSSGFVVHEATYFATLADVEAADVVVTLYNP